MRSIATMSPSNLVVMDEPVNGSNHHYRIQNGEFVLDINFQKGPRNHPDSITGCFESDLFNILKDRLKGFQSGPYANEENQTALMLIEQAEQALGRRAAERVARGVLGKNEK